MPIRNLIILNLFFMSALFTRLLCAVVLSGWMALGFSQTPAVTTNIPNDLSACSEAVFTITVSNPGDQPSAVGTLQYCFSSGLAFAGASGVGLADSADARCPVLDLPSVPAQGSLTFDLRVRVGCFALDAGDRRDTIRLTLGGTPQPPLLGQAYNIRVPIITLTPGNNWSFSGSNGDVFTRTFTIRNEGLGNAYRVIVLDAHAQAGLQLIQTTGSIQGDTLVLSGLDLGAQGFLAFRDSVVVSQTFRLNSCAVSSNTVAYGWACADGTSCTTLRPANYIVSATGGDTVEVVLSFEKPFAPPKPCEQETVVLLLENRGGTPVFNVEWIHAIVSSEFAPAQEGIKWKECYPMSDFRVGNTSVADASGGGAFEPYRFLLSAFTADPDGPSGFSDEDGDGQFDDLAPGAVAMLSFVFSFNPACKECNSLQGSSFIASSAVFTNSCGQQTSAMLTPSGATGIRLDQARVEIEQDFILQAGTTYTFDYDLSIMLLGLSDICPQDSVIAQFTLPVTLDVPPAFSPRLNGITMSWWRPNDTTLNLLLPSNIGRLEVPLLTLCPPDIDNSAICTPTYEPRTYQLPLRVFWTCGNGCPLTYELVCLNGSFFTVDCPRPPEADSLLHGVFADTFSVQRLTLGYVDNVLSAKVSPSPDLKLDIALPFDTVLMRAVGHIKGFPGETFDSTKVEIYYWNGLSEYFQLLSITLWLDDAESGTSVSCTDMPLDYQFVNGYHIWAFDLLPLSEAGGCFAQQGVRLTAGDSLRVEVLARMTEALPNRKAEVISDLRIRFPYRYGGDTLLCETANANFRCINPQYDINLFALAPNGVCNTMSLDVTLQQGISNQGLPDLFPREIRPLFVYDTLTIEVPPGFRYVPGSTLWSYRLGDGADSTPAAVPLPLDDPEIITLPDGRVLLRYVRPPDLPVTDYYTGASFSIFTLRLDALCPPDTSLFPVSMVGRSYLSIYDTVNVFYNNLAILLEDLNETSLSVVNSASSLRTPTWLLKLCNPKAGMVIPEPIMFWENNPRMPVLSIEDLAAPAFSPPLVIEPWPDGRLATRLRSLPTDECIELRLRAQAPADCQPDTLYLQAGFQCPSESEPCMLKGGVEVYFAPQSAQPQLIALAPLMPVDLCQPATYEIYLVNQGEGFMYDISLLLQMPELGQDYVPGSLSVHYGALSATLPDPVQTPEGLLVLADLGQLPLGIEALPGLAFAPQNTLVFRFQTTPNCDYLDFARIRYRASWQDACEGKANLSDVFIAPKLTIAGAPSASNNYDLALSAPVSSICRRMPLRVRIVNPGNLGPTQAGEKVRLVLPDHFSYVPGSLQALHNGPNAEPASMTADGLRLIVFEMPPGVVAGDSVVFTFQVESNLPLTSCSGIYPAILQMLQETDLPCGAGSCSVDFTMLEQAAALTLEKPNYTLTGLEGIAIPVDAATENWQMDVRLLNNSSAIGGGAIALEVRLDANQDGQLAPSDPLLASWVVSVDGLLPGEVRAFSFNINVQTLQGCSGLWVVLADTACACVADTAFVSFVPLTNGSQDLTLCAGETTMLGATPLAGASYQWLPASPALSSTTIANPTYRYDGPFDATLQREEVLVVQITRAQGCTSFDTVRITTRKVEATLSPTPALCAGDSNGTLTASVAGAQPPVAYQWSNGATGDAPLTQLPAGLYTLTVTDALGCSDVKEASVAEPAPLVVQLIPSDFSGFGVSCAGAADGTISALASGGTGAYAYDWTPAVGTGSVLSGLTAGTYSLTLTDANGCTATALAELAEPQPLQLTLTPQDERCVGTASGAIGVSIQGGAAPYRVNDQPPGGATQVLVGLSGGTYSVAVTDANGCATTAEATLETLTSEVELSITPASCFGGGDGRAEVSATGYAPFGYVWSNGAISAAITAPAGAYEVTVSDALGCTYVLQASIGQPLALTGQAVASAVLCFGDSTGRIDLTAQGGTPPYQFLLGTQAVVSPLTGLPPGTYFFQLTDANGCTVALSATVTQPPPLSATLATVDVRCYGEETGSIEAQSAGGVPPYVFQWSNGSTGAIIQRLAAGTYTLTLSDANGCTSVTSAEVTEPEPYEPTFEVLRWPCADRPNGLLAVSGFPDGTRYGLNQSPNSGVPRFSAVGGGPLTLFVEDTAGCRSQYDFLMPALPAQLGTAYADTTIRLGDSAWLRAEVSPDVPNPAEVRFQWLEPAAVLSGCDTCPNLWVRPLRTALYTAVFSTESGCFSESRVLVRVLRDSIYAPNVIYPDALQPENQRFTLYARPGALRQIKYLLIFDRWGEHIFEQRNFAPNDPALGWDGRYKGQNLTPGVFVWYAEVEYFDGETEVIKGSLTIVR